jgi:maleate isomerase
VTRLGMIVPSSNTCLEPVTSRPLSLVPDITAHFTRIRVTPIGLDAGSDEQFTEAAMRAAAELLADANVDAIAWNGTSGSWLGIARDRALAQALRDATCTAVTTSTLAFMDAFRAFGVRRLGLLTPYTADVAAAIVAEYGRAGIEAAADEHLGLTENDPFARVSHDQLTTMARAAAGVGVDALAIVCTNVPGAVSVARLEAELGIPVLDSVSVTLWHALEAAGAPRAIEGWGSLLATGSFRTRAQDVCEDLRAATGCDRTTLRVDLPAWAVNVDHAVAESTGPGVRPIRFDSSLDQRRLSTVAWLEQARQNLVQPHFRAAPEPPAALVDVYGVQAQMLGPVERNGLLVGWLSAHSMTERAWSPADQAALDQARADIQGLLPAVG